MRNKLLIVEDNSLNRIILTDMLEEDFKILEASNGQEALDIIEKESSNIAAIFLDIQMPVMNGIECMEVLKSRNLLQEFPIIVVTADTDSDTEEKCLNLGAYDFVKKPFNPLIVKKRIDNAVSLFTYKNNLEGIVKRQTKEIIKKNETLKVRNKQLKDFNYKTIELLSEVCEARSMECGTHIKRVKGYTKALLKTLAKEYKEYNLTDEKIERITDASAMHDLGKIAISDSILLKPGRLTPEEFAEMKKHTTEGVKILDYWKEFWDDEYYQLCVDICKYHHEKYDGRGYPCGLIGDQIPISAQVVSIADCFDALTTDRVYKKAFTVDVAYEMILNGECGTFNPKLINCFKKVEKTFKKIYNSTNEQGE